MKIILLNPKILQLCPRQPSPFRTRNIIKAVTGYNSINLYWCNLYQVF